MLRIKVIAALAASLFLTTPLPSFLRQQPQEVAPEGARAAVPSFAVPDFSRTTKVPVIRIVDGDTVVVSADGIDTKVRLIGVDTPETVDPRKPVQAYGKAASHFLSNLLRGEDVYLEDSEGPDRLDKYGRRLCYIYRAPDGLFVNAEIVRQGYGHAYTKYPFKFLEGFRQLEERARTSQKGLWDPLLIPEEPPPVFPPAPTSPPEAGGPAKSTETKEVTVYVTRTGSKYHLAGCRYLSKSKIPIALGDARARYGACSVCRPPE